MPGPFELMWPLPLEPLLGSATGRPTPGRAASLCGPSALGTPLWSRLCSLLGSQWSWCARHATVTGRTLLCGHGALGGRVWLASHRHFGLLPLVWLVRTLHGKGAIFRNSPSHMTARAAQGPVPTALVMTGPSEGPGRAGRLVPPVPNGPGQRSGCFPLLYCWGVFLRPVTLAVTSQTEGGRVLGRPGAGDQHP